MCTGCTLRDMTKTSKPKTKLAAWMKDNGITDADLAEMVGTSREQINRVRNGVSSPSWGLAAKLKAATRGVITADDFLPDAAA